MCGIFGYIGAKDPLKMCLNGLEQLEYRGYDSTGIAGISEGHLSIFKEAGKLSFLKPKIPLQALDVVIGHTRWATHGKVSSPNAHPHTDEKHSIALIHNGIIENYASLKEGLKKEDVHFQSETDTEVIVHLISKHYKGDLVEAVHKTLPLLRGIFAIALIHKDHPDQIVATTRECPLSIGYDDKHTESILSSDPNAFLGSILNVLFLRNGEIARVRKGSVDVFDASLKLILKKPERFESEYKPAAKEGFEHFMLKEIFEQPATIQKAMLGSIVENHVELEPLHIDSSRIENIWILGCGTSAHAGAIATLYFEDLAGIPASSEISSEARYRTPILTPNTLVIAVSQS